MTSVLCLPISANYRFSNRWKVRLGVFASYRMDGDFSGYVGNGYLREGTPIGNKKGLRLADLFCFILFLVVQIGLCNN